MAPALLIRRSSFEIVLATSAAAARIDCCEARSRMMVLMLTPGYFSRSSSATASSLDLVRERRRRLAGYCDANAAAVPCPQLLGETPVTMTRTKLDTRLVFE